MPAPPLEHDDLAAIAEVRAATASTGIAEKSLYHDRGFWSMAVTQFLGAFNDNLFKQLVLLIATPTAAELAAGTSKDRQGEAQIIFAAAFLIFSGVAGFVADRISKRIIVVSAKVAEILIMFLGLIGFWYFDVIGLNGLFVVLFLMGVHSTFFAPAKYGILPEMVRPAELPAANGIFLMLTFLAIIFGTASAGALRLYFGERVWIGSLLCMGIAVLGTLTATGVPRVPPAQPNLRHTWSSWGISADIRKLLLADRELMWAMVASTMFWLVGGMTLPSVNALGITQLGLNEKLTSFMTASIGLGIAIGCMLGGRFSRGRVNRRVVIGGAVGTVITLGVLSVPGSNHGHSLGFWGSLPVLVLMGLFAGMFVVPVQVMLQSRPARNEKGRMMATMNQFSWIGVVAGALIFQGSIRVLEATNGPRCLLFAVTAALMLPVALFYRPQDQALAEN